MPILTMEQLKPDMCRWPSGDPKDADFHFCGARCIPGAPYCNTHMHAAHPPAKKRTET